MHRAAELGRRLNSAGHRAIAAVSCLLVATAVTLAEPPDLASDQADLAQRFERLETLAKRIAELTEADDPARAEQLRGAIRKSQELDLAARFDAIVALLEQEQLAAAARDQQTLAEQLRVLLQLLLADPAEARDEARRKWLKEVLKALERHIRTQQDLRSAALSEADCEKVAGRQAELAKRIDELRRELSPGGKQQAGEPPGDTPPGGDAGQPPSESEIESESPSPSSRGGSSGQSDGRSGGGNNESDESTQRAAEQLEIARKRMREAIDEFEQAQRDGGERKQADAQRRLEDARSEIEEALRQLREEELQRRLTKLATRLRRMLAEQIDILKLTSQTEEDRPNRGRRATAVAATGLANRERQLVTTADGALRLLEEDGGSIAFPEVLEQIREDMVVIAERLRKTQVGAITQRLEQEVIEALEEAVDALDKTLEEMEQRRQQQQQGQGGQPSDPAVVDRLAELRMILAVQSRIKRRTEFWRDLRAAGEANPEEVETALQRAAQRQAKLMRAIRNLDRSPGS